MRSLYVREISGPLALFCCEPKATLKNREGRKGCHGNLLRNLTMGLGGICPGAGGARTQEGRIRVVRVE